MKKVHVYLIVAMPDDDDREPKEIADAIVASLSLEPDLIYCEISAPLAEEQIG